MDVFNISLKILLKKYPRLAFKKEDWCECGRKPTGVTSCVIKDMAFCQAETCECGKPGVVVMVPRDETTNQKWLNFLKINLFNK